MSGARLVGSVTGARLVRPSGARFVNSPTGTDCCCAGAPPLPCAAGAGETCGHFAGATPTVVGAIWSGLTYPACQAGTTVTWKRVGATLADFDECLNRPVGELCTWAVGVAGPRFAVATDGVCTDWFAGTDFLMGTVLEMIAPGRARIRRLGGNVASPELLLAFFAEFDFDGVTPVLGIPNQVTGLAAGPTYGGVTYQAAVATGGIVSVVPCCEVPT